MKIRSTAAVVTILAVSGCASIQPVAEADKSIERVIEVSGQSQDQIYNGAKVWLATTFKSAKAVIEHDSKENGVIIGNGVIPYPCAGLECIAKADWKVPFTMRVDVKDNKFKMTFTNINLSWPSSYNSTVGFSSGHNGPVSTQGEMNAIKPALLSLGDQLAKSLGEQKANSD